MSTFKNMNGKYVNQITWIDVDPDGTITHQTYRPDFAHVAKLSYEEVGDRVEIWIVESTVGTDEEIQRFNVKNIDIIKWKEGL